MDFSTCTLIVKDFKDKYIGQIIGSVYSKNIVKKRQNVKMDTNILKYKIIMCF